MKRRLAAALALPLVAAVFVLLVWPLCALGYASLHRAGAFTLANYARILGDEAFRTSLLHSLVLSFCVAAGATLVSLVPAWFLARHEFYGQRLVRAAFTLPSSLSGIMVGFLAVIMLGRVGFIPQVTEKWLGSAWLSGTAYQLSGLIIAYLYFEIPRGVLALEAALTRFDPRLIDAAASLGANGWQRWRWVIFPLIRPALLSTFAFTFNVSLGSFGVALILSRRLSVLPLEIFYQFTAMSDASLAAAMAISIAIVALVIQYTLAGSRSAEA
jgi:putative spermidine/putrescine transport system permease protein